MRVQILTKANGYGLTKDVQVIREALEPIGATVDVTPYDRPRSSGYWDFNIHSEHIGIGSVDQARVNIALPNPDWFEEKWIPQLEHIDIVAAKTRDTERIFSQLHKSVTYTGWTSPDTDARVDYSMRSVVHNAGNSRMKGTNQVIAAMRYVPDARATLTANYRPGVKVPQNVKATFRRLNDDEFARTRMAPIHLCPSSYEGFGHYINEARSMGAVVITTNAAPMNELITDRFGILVPHTGNVGRHMLSPQYQVDEQSLAHAIEVSLSVPSETLAALGAEARKAYESDRADFTERFRRLFR